MVYLFTYFIYSCTWDLVKDSCLKKCCDWKKFKFPSNLQNSNLCKRKFCLLSKNCSSNMFTFRKPNTYIMWMQ